ncbi:MAG: LysM peptidoglycan-binding domain-containing protein [Dehalococcoidia bacterium]
MRFASTRVLVPLALILVTLIAVVPHISASERGPSTYIVQPGDTLSEIADRFGTTVEALVALNGLDDAGRIVAGQSLRLTSGASDGAPSSRVYRVQPGDTLWEIAQAQGVSVPDLARANGMSITDVLRTGMELHIPSTAPIGTAPADRIHVVSAGETLSSVADDFAVNVDSLRSANGLESDLIRVGQTLRVPQQALPQLSKQTAAALHEAASESGVDPYLLLALSLMESGWQNHVVSSTGAVGLMQLMPETAEWTVDHLATGADHWDGSLEDNARVGAAYFGHLLFIEGGDVEGALASYYQGWASYKQYGMYEETRDYVDDVLALEARLRARGTSG